MDEFVSRMATQRQVLGIVNSRLGLHEKLFGLSSNAIDRWAVTNQLGPSSEVVKLVKNISSELFFMATSSQEPVSCEYEIRKEKIIEAIAELENSV
ncbi:hypothetical protein [Billgrantia endophytica]|uniref:Uncharacterized protein n=1 Tax=Billgrantia endophytica TaxID=2033802 RepID=A0A2N7U227_9GAMM|nr:hypothetical protein [Halomonas endophytica]PMR74488.1 hypothetical protein C1H69_14720 [Halomonas endophytica]